MSPLRAPRHRLVVLSQSSAGYGEGFAPSAAQRVMRRIKRRLRQAGGGPLQAAGPPAPARAPEPQQVQPGGLSAGWARVVGAVRSLTDRVLRFLGLR